jgi:hypothetical protein
VLEIDKGLVLPDALAEGFPGYDLAGNGDEGRQHLQRLRTQPNTPTSPSKVAGGEIQLEFPESDPARSWHGIPQRPELYHVFRRLGAHPILTDLPWNAAGEKPYSSFGRIQR